MFSEYEDGIRSTKQRNHDLFGDGVRDLATILLLLLLVDEYARKALENQLLSVSLLTHLGKHECIERISSGNSLHTTLPLIWLIPLKIVPKDDDSRKEEPKAGERVVEQFDMFPTKSEIRISMYLCVVTILQYFLRNPSLQKDVPSNLKIPCNIGHVHVEKAYINLNSPLNIMTRRMYNWIMRRKLDPRENSNGGVSNFIGRIKGMHVFVGNFTYIVDFMIVEDISSVINPRLSQVVLGRPFVEISNMTHDLPEGVVRFINRTNEVALRLPLHR
ncbi:MAK10-like protein [Tanacetum coccineum]